MKIGFTGTRHGMTEAQNNSVVGQMVALSMSELHHGSCQGADVEAARLATLAFALRRVKVVCHPGPDDDPYRKISGFDDVTLPPKNHFARNRDIVDASEVLLACPFDMTAQPYGGTWYTIGYATKKGKPVRIVWPDGRVEVRP